MAADIPKANLINDPVEFTGLLQHLETDIRVLLLLPDDFYDLYEAALNKRMAAFKMNATIARVDYPEEKLKEFDYILRYHCSLPVVPKVPFKNKETFDFFEVKGAPSSTEMVPFQREEAWLTKLDQRFLYLKTLNETEECDIHFQKLAETQHHVRNNLLIIQQHQQKLDHLTDEMVSIQELYYRGLKHLLWDALEKTVGVHAIISVMQRFVKILIIDDLGEQSIEQVVKFGYSKSNLAHIDSEILKELYQQFAAKNKKVHPSEEVTLEKFFTDRHVLKEYDIIIYNAWDNTDNQLLVNVCIRQLPVVSRKEQQQLDRNPKKIAEELEILDQTIQQLTGRLQKTQKKLHYAETVGGMEEQEYQGLERKRKYLILDLKRQKNRLKQLQKQVSLRTKSSFSTYDLVKILKKHQSFSERLNEKVSIWQGLDELKPGRKSSQRKSAAVVLSELAELARQKRTITKKIKGLNQQTGVIVTKMEKYAQQHVLSPKKKYQQVLGTHALHCLEQHILGCGIAHLNQILHHYPGNYFQVEGIQSRTAIQERLVKVNVCVVAKTTKMPTHVLEKVFSVDEPELFVRMHMSSTLPEAEEFQNKEFDLLIIPYNQFSIQSILACLKRRNQSQNSHIPVLIFIPERYKIDALHKLQLDLAIGVIQDKDTHIKSPSYLIHSLDHEDSLISILCEVIGFSSDMITTPGGQTSASASDDFFIEDQQEREQFLIEATKQIEHQTQIDQKLTGTGEHPGDLSASDDSATQQKSSPDLVENDAQQEVEISIPTQQVEEIYTIGSLFAFDDEEEGFPEGRFPEERFPEGSVPEGRFPERLLEDTTENSVVTDSLINPETEELPLKNVKATSEKTQEGTDNEEVLEDLYEASHLF